MSRLMSFITSGTRVVLGVLIAAFLATITGKITGLYDLNRALALSGPSFRDGQVWQIVTYVILPASLLSFLMNGVMIAFLGASLERIWSRRELWFYCVLVTFGTGVSKLVFQFSVPTYLIGSAPLAFGLLAAWGFLFRHEKVPFIFGEITVGLLAWLAGMINFALLVLSTGLGNALIGSSGALTGLLYLWIQLKIIMSRGSRIVPSNRIHRLEL